MQSLRTRPADDLTVLQKFPLMRIGPGVYVCLDPGFLLDKAGRGAVWSLISQVADRRLQGRILSFWGTLFEQYVNFVLSRSYSAGGELVPEPRFVNGDQAFDACPPQGQEPSGV
jgi:hypothetical protein